jgi:uncharacterized damage-inducible protein DinB
MTEPWQRGPIDGVDPLIAPVLYSFQQAREDLREHTRGLTPADVWARPHGFGSLGFHVRHLGGSADRLCTYLEGRQLSESQLDYMKREAEPGASRDELIDEMEAHLSRVEMVVRGLDPATLREPRYVGRKRLPATVIGLLVHIAEHTQRHVGQAISAAKLARAMGESVT